AAMDEAAADATAAEPPDERPQGFTPWRQRVGPAYPDDSLRSFGRWAKELPATLWDDTTYTFTNPETLLLLTLAAGAGGAVHCSADHDVADHYAEEGSCLSDDLDNWTDALGSPATHFGIGGAMLLTSLHRGDVKNYERSKTLLNALAINGMLTLALKGIVSSDSPNGAGCGWPSGHTSSSFCFAAVMYDQYGPEIGIPLYAFAAFVGYERVDARNHDLSDVVSGALIGVAIARAVCRNHNQRLKLLGMDVIPYASPSTGGVGLALTKSW
ncbi:MAG: phosphatase PAP2 family protein, partial [Phycisphaerae bacterium]|nr:phosphatase PAP2 family protein [Phycisphaerae bacterium]